VRTPPYSPELYVVEVVVAGLKRCPPRGVGDDESVTRGTPRRPPASIARRSHVPPPPTRIRKGSPQDRESRRDRQPEHDAAATCSDSGLDTAAESDVSALSARSPSRLLSHQPTISTTSAASDDPDRRLRLGTASRTAAGRQRSRPPRRMAPEPRPARHDDRQRDGQQAQQDPTAAIEAARRARASRTNSIRRSRRERPAGHADSRPAS